MRSIATAALTAAACLLLPAAAGAQAADGINSNVLHDGDLLFFAHSKGNAITDVTTGVGNAMISHVAIVNIRGGKAYTIEATHRGVITQPVDSVLEKADKDGTQIMAACIVPRPDIATSVSNAMKYLGRPYDFYFERGDSAIYCSELVELSFRDSDGTPVFRPVPMSFHDRNGTITDYWKEYYRKAGKTVPEGEPGSNPGEMSRDKRVRIMFTLSRQKKLHDTALR